MQAVFYQIDETPVAAMTVKVSKQRINYVHIPEAINGFHDICKFDIALKHLDDIIIIILILFPVFIKGAVSDTGKRDKDFIRIVSIEYIIYGTK